MVTGVGVIKILFAQLNSLTLKPYVLCKNWGHISSTNKVIANFLLKFVKNFRYHGNRGRLSKV